MTDTPTGQADRRSADAALEATALGKRFGRRGRRALHDCTFRLPTGRVCAVVGHNGAGKSTLLATATGTARVHPEVSA